MQSLPSLRDSGGKSSSKGAIGPSTLLRRCMLALTGGWILAILAITLYSPAHRHAQSFEDVFGQIERAAGEIIRAHSLDQSASLDPLTEADDSNDVTLPEARPKPPGWNKDPMDYPKPTTFFDIEIGGQPVGRIVFALYTKQSPRAAENFRSLCTGEKGNVPNESHREGAGQPLHFKGHEFYRVIDQFICQTGANVESVYGGMFEDDEGGLLLKHNKKGLLSMANAGPNTNTAHFSILMGPAPHLDGHYTIFGEVVKGMEVVDKINSLAKPPGSPDERPQRPVLIANSGQLVCDEGGGSCTEISGTATT